MLGKADAMKIIDLSLRLKHGMPGVQLETKFTVARDGWNARTLHLYSHCGTHMDSPMHFNAGSQTIDEIPLSDCIGRAWLIDLDNLEPRTPITVAHLGDACQQIVSGDAILLRTLWSRHVDNPQYYRDNLPQISRELAKWMVERKIRLVV